MFIINAILDLGAIVMLPILIFILSLIFGEKPGRALRAGVTIGIGFIGINLVIGLLSSNLVLQPKLWSKTQVCSWM